MSLFVEIRILREDGTTVMMERGDAFLARKWSAGQSGPVIDSDKEIALAGWKFMPVVMQVESKERP